MAIKLDWRNVGKGLSAIAEAKQERDYREAIAEKRKEYETQREAARAEPTQQMGLAPGYTQQDVTDAGLMAMSDDEYVVPEVPYYTLPGSEQRYQSRTEAMAARPRGPSEWEFAREKADIAEQMGLYDRAEQLRGGALKAMQAQAAEIELQSKQLRSGMIDAFYRGGGLDGVLQQINSFTGGNLDAEYDEKTGGVKIYETTYDAKGNAKRAPTGLEFDSSSDALEYALALTSPETFGPYLQSQREARIKAQTQQRARDEGYADRLLERIGNLEGKNMPLSTKEQNELDQLRTDYFKLEQRLTGPGAGGAGLLGRIQDERARRTGGAGPQAADARAGQPQVYPTPAPRGAEESRFTQGLKSFQGEAAFDQKLRALGGQISMGIRDTGGSREDTGLPGTGVLNQIYGYFADTPDKEAVRNVMSQVEAWVESPAGRQYFADNPTDLDAVLSGEKDLLGLWMEQTTPPQEKANGGLVRRYAEGGNVLKDKKYDEAMRNRNAAANAQRVKDANADAAAKKADRAERMGALQKAGEYFSSAQPSYGAADDANLAYTPTVDFDLRYRQPEYLRSGGLVMRDYRRGGAVKGPGTETSDSIPARLSDGEYVVNAESMKIAGVPELLEAINKMGLQKRKSKKA